MDSNTLIILALLGVALSWWFSILIVEERQFVKQSKKEAIDRMERDEMVKRLSGKL